tara:strand:+ start:255 stop:581 length:327 start_codon:yes stop_codon:yes gene_type:complete
VSDGAKRSESDSPQLTKFILSSCHARFARRPKLKKVRAMIGCGMYKEAVKNVLTPMMEEEKKRNKSKDKTTKALDDVIVLLAECYKALGKKTDAAALLEIGERASEPC